MIEPRFVTVNVAPPNKWMERTVKSVTPGQAAIWNVIDGFMQEVTVEHYNEGCESGLIFKDARGTEFYQFIRSIA